MQMQTRKGIGIHRPSSQEVPAALPADEAARIAFEHDQSLSRHRFVEGEHPVVRIEHLGKTFTDVPVLRDVNLNVWNGEIVVVLGPSGSGKSTMLRCINLLEQPTQGHILVGDQELTGASKANLSLLRRDVGMVFQSFNLFPHLSAKENVVIGQMKVLRKSREEAEREAMRQLEAVGLADRADYRPPQLSGGQQQRVAIARALACEPEYILCDEATSALDPASTASVLSLLKRINDTAGVTIVIITHSMDVVRQVCKSVAVLSHGRLVERGSVDEVFSNPQNETTKALLGRVSWND